MSEDGNRRLTPLEIIAEWRRGCSNTIVSGEPPENCPECARDVIGVLDRALSWQPIETAPRDRYVLLFSPEAPAWDGNMEVGRWYGYDEGGGWWSCGGPNGGLELSGPGAPGHYGGRFTHWRELPEPPV